MAGMLADKSIVVTGGATGIGRATALRCAAEGAALTIADVNAEAAVALCEEIVAGGGRAHFVATDVTDAAQVQAMVASAVAAYGRLDGAFNNAGIEGRFVSILKMTEDEYDRTVNVDLKGVWLCVKYQVEQMIKQESAGSIVSTASVAGLVGSRGGSAYCAAKHGVVGLTKSVSLEYARKGIRVNAVCPGVILTPMVERLTGDTGVSYESLVAQEPVGRLGEPREIGEAVVWLLSDLSSFVTGIAMPVDGGYTAL
ncbi:MAG: glucose 1-dehydrogenase [Gammaproteobacteria bacterium]|nr:glucose 1-dehydrogenase [Gammaproteobacteria bacterium]MCP5198662.1 glucose 1-dehydrogenase [Gammaproteobacteria bacterium]